MGMGIGDKIGNGNGKEWETTCMGMGIAIIPTWNQFPSADTVLSLCNSTVGCKLIMVIGYYVTLTENNICDFLRKSKIKTYNIVNYYFSGFCTITRKPS